MENIMSEPTGLNIKGIFRTFPFTAYDVFGYFLPGLAFILSVLAFEYSVNDKLVYLNANKTGADSIAVATQPCTVANGDSIPEVNEQIPYFLFLNFNKLFGKMYEENQPNFVYLILFLIVTIVLCYFMGHIISAVSSLFIDRIFIYKAYGYPFERFLKLQQVERFYSQDYYRACFFYINVLMISFYFKLFWFDTLFLQIIQYFIVVLLMVLFVVKLISNRI